MRGYVICTSPRSGSNYLCELLTSTGVLGVPLGYFNGPGRRRHDNDPTYPDDAALQIQRILSQGATSNGVYGFKIFPAQFYVAAKRTSLADQLPGLRYVRLARRDVLGQALSWSRLKQTGQSRSTAAAAMEAFYDGATILDRLRALAHHEASWDFYFYRTGIEALVLYYEDVQAAPQEAVDSIAAWMEVKEAARINAHRLRLQIQRDPTTEEWRSRFLQEYGDPNLFHAV